MQIAISIWGNAVLRWGKVSSLSRAPYNFGTYRPSDGLSVRALPTLREQCGPHEVVARRPPLRYIDCLWQGRRSNLRAAPNTGNLRLTAKLPTVIVVHVA